MADLVFNDPTHTSFFLLILQGVIAAGTLQVKLKDLNFFPLQVVVLFPKVTVPPRLLIKLITPVFNSSLMV